MKITKRQLQQIIKEELSAVLGESEVQEGLMDKLRGAKGLRQETNDQPIDPKQPHQSDEELEKNREDQDAAWKMWMEAVKEAYGRRVAQFNRCAQGLATKDGRDKCAAAAETIKTNLARDRRWKIPHMSPRDHQIRIQIKNHQFTKGNWPSPLWPADTFTAPDENDYVWWPKRISRSS